MVTLQWGRDLLIAERAEADALGITMSQASMGPRFINRGEPLFVSRCPVRRRKAVCERSRWERLVLEGWRRCGAHKSHCSRDLRFCERWAENSRHLAARNQLRC